MQIRSIKFAVRSKAIQYRYICLQCWFSTLHYFNISHWRRGWDPLSNKRIAEKTLPYLEQFNTHEDIASVGVHWTKWLKHFENL